MLDEGEREGKVSSRTKGRGEVERRNRTCGRLRTADKQKKESGPMSKHPRKHETYLDPSRRSRKQIVVRIRDGRLHALLQQHRPPHRLLLCDRRDSAYRTRIEMKQKNKIRTSERAKDDARRRERKKKDDSPTPGRTNPRNATSSSPGFTISRRVASQGRGYSDPSQLSN